MGCRVLDLLDGEDGAAIQDLLVKVQEQVQVNVGDLGDVGSRIGVGVGGAQAFRRHVEGFPSWACNQNGDEGNEKRAEDKNFIS